MAIATDAFTNVSQGPGNHSYAHTCTGGDLILFVGASGDDGDDITACTYNSVSMTEVAKVNAFGAEFVYLYMLVNPATGSNTVQFTSTAGNMRSSSGSYTGAAQTWQQR